MGNEVKSPLGVVKGYLLPYPRRFEKAKIIPDTDRIMEGLLRSFANMVSDVRVEDERSLKKFCDIFVCGIMGSFSDRKYDFVKGYLEGYNFGQRYERKFFRTALKDLPADTRIVGNTSSLLIHLLASSAIACAIAKKRHVEGIDYEILRCAALFHEIGKPFYSTNRDLGEEKFREFFESLFSKELLKKVLSLIETWRKPVGELGEILKLASEFSAATDQLEQIAAEYEKEHFGGKISDPKTIQTLKLMETTAEYLEKKDELWIERLNEAATKFKEDKDSEVALVFGDARGIKKYVDKSNTIYEIIGGSKRVERGTEEAVKRILKNGLIELENLIVFAGGSVYLSCSSAVLNEVEKGIRETFAEHVSGVRIAISSVKPPLQDPPPFGVIWSHLCRKNRRDKDSEKKKEKVLISIARLCDSCHETGATEEYPPWVSESDRKYLYCGNCAEKGTEGKKFLEGLRPQPPLSEYIPEFIAGHGLQEIIKHDLAKKDIHTGKRMEEYLNLAVIKADGNLFGEFLARSPSLSEVIEKSVRLEQAMDGIRRDIRKMISSLQEKEEYEWRFDMGMVYFAGDDFLMFGPSFMAYPLALNLIKKFYEKMGKTCRLSVGIAAGNPMYPTQSLMEIAEEEVRLGKAEDTKIHEEEKYAGVLSYEVIVGGAFSARLAESKLRTLKRKGMSARPLVVFEDEANKDPKNAVTLAKETLKISDPFSIKEYVEAFNKLHKERGKHDWKRIQRRLLAIASMIDIHKEKVDNDRRLAILASMRQYTRLGRDEGYLKAFELLAPPAIRQESSLKFQKAARILDAMALLRLCGGGIL